MISREEAIKILKGTALYRYAAVTGDWSGDYATAINMAIEALSTERPKGRWEWDVDYDAPKCSHCGEHEEQWDDPGDFCRRCGADMRGEE